MSNIKSKQKFLNGVNRRFSREDSVNPDYFYSLSNTRIFKRGNTGKAVRIKGFQSITSGKDYSEIFDIISFRDKYVVLYRSASYKVSIDVLDGDGTVHYTQEFTTIYEPLDGGLEQFDNTVYLSPYNKILYYDETSPLDPYTFQDYISKIPSIDMTLKGTNNFAQGYIEPTSGVNTQQEGPTIAICRVRINNTAIGEVDEYDLDFDGVTTPKVQVQYQDTKEDIATKLYDAFKSTSLTNNWDISMSPRAKNIRGVGTAVYFRSKTPGYSYNGQGIEINNSTFNVHRKRTRGIRLIGGRIPPISRDPVDVKPPIIDDGTIVTTEPPVDDGSDTTNYGPLYIRLEPNYLTIKTDNLIDGDTETTVADKIERAFDGVDEYVTVRSGNRINIKSANYGEKENGTILLSFNRSDAPKVSDVFTYNKQNLQSGSYENDEITLEKQTSYWYKAKYRYLDGHKGYSCQPKYVNTGELKAVQLIIDTPELDLNGDKPSLQIFRKKEGEDFFMIDDIDINDLSNNVNDDIYYDVGNERVIYTDRGKFKIDDDGIKDNIWTEKHNTQTVLNSRLVYGGIEYFEEKYNGGSYTFSTVNNTGEDDNRVLPKNSKIRLYVKPKYKNGTEGYHKKVGTIDVNGANKKLKVNQTSTEDNNDKEIKELSFYANYQEHEGSNTYPFNTFELSNKNVPTIAEKDYFPNNTRVLFGFKYIELWGRNGVVSALGWDSGDENSFNTDYVDVNSNTGCFSIGFKSEPPVNNIYPRKFSINIMGVDLTYVRIGMRTNGAYPTTTIYKLANMKAIKTAISTGSLYIKLANSNVSGLSSQYTNQELKEEKVKITGIEDKSMGFGELNLLDTKEENVLVGPNDSRIYLILDKSKLDEIDNNNINDYSFKQNYALTNAFDDGWGPFGAGKNDGFVFPTTEESLNGWSLSFELLNFEQIQGPVYEPYTNDKSGNDGGRKIPTERGDYYSYVGNWEMSKYSLSEVITLEGEKSFIYLGTKDNTLTDKEFEVTGYTYGEKEETLKYNSLAPYNIYEQGIFQKDLNLDRTTFNNQIIWTDPLIKGNQYSGGRDISSTSFYNMGSKNGEILKLESLNGTLYAFCENGVSKLLIGEVLTQQGGGQVTVDSSNFITENWWLVENLEKIQKHSIKKVDDKIFFSDGNDVFIVTGGGIQNITEGKIPLDLNNTYYAGIDLSNDEYLLSDSTNNITWSYNYLFGAWTGPHDFIITQITNKDGVVIGSSGGQNINEYNKGNTFGGANYELKIESVANDTNQSFFDKIYRKFYLQTNNKNNSIFSYGKDPNVMISKNIENLRIKNEYSHVGINGSDQNSKTIFYKITSPTDGFELRDISWIFQKNYRR